MSVDVREALKNSQLFKDFPDAELGKLAAIARQHQLNPGTELFRSGDAGDEVFVLAMGTVKVLKLNNEGDNEEIAVLGSGSHFGEMALVATDHTRSATIEAQELSHLVGLKQADLEKICTEDMTLGYHFFRTLSSTLARRLRNTSDFVAHFKGMSQKRR
jgi:CRP-like cAMP-binding protein